MLWEIFINVTESAVLLFALYHYLAPKAHYLYAIFIICSRVILITIINTFTVHTAFTVWIILSYDILITILCFRGRIAEKMIFPCINILITIIANNITFATAYFILETNNSKLIEFGQTRYIMTGYYVLVCAILVLIFCKLDIKSGPFTTTSYITILIFLCLSTFGSNHLLDIITDLQTKKQIEKDIFHLNFVNVIFLLLLFTFLFLIQYLGNTLNRNYELMQERQQHILEKQHYNTIDQTVGLLRTWKHDFKNHLEVIGGFIKAEQYEQLNTYLAELMIELPQADLVSTGNHYIDAILSSKIMEAKNHSITFNYHIFIPEQLPTDPVSFTSLLGNLLDNSITSCQNISDPEQAFITLTIKPYQNMLSIKVENSSNGNYRFNENKQLISTKEESGHGLGLKRIKQIVTAVNGYYTIDPCSTKFTIRILLPMAENLIFAGKEK